MGCLEAGQLDVQCPTVLRSGGGDTAMTEIVKMAVTLLTGKALTWWRSVANKNWARLGICTW